MPFSGVKLRCVNLILTGDKRGRGDLGGASSLQNWHSFVRPHQPTDQRSQSEISTGCLMVILFQNFISKKLVILINVVKSRP